MCESVRRNSKKAHCPHNNNMREPPTSHLAGRWRVRARCGHGADGRWAARGGTEKRALSSTHFLKDMALLITHVMRRPSHVLGMVWGKRACSTRARGGASHSWTTARARGECTLGPHSRPGSIVTLWRRRLSKGDDRQQREQYLQPDEGDRDRIQHLQHAGAKVRSRGSPVGPRRSGAGGARIRIRGRDAPDRHASRRSAGAGSRR